MPGLHTMPNLYIFFIRTGLVFTPFLFSISYYATCIFPTGVNEMDWLYLLLILAFFGLSVLLVFGIEKLGRPS
jgi:hypothetical protein